MLFHCAFGLEIVEERAGLALVGGEVLFRHDDDLAGESMAKGVERRTLFAGVGARAGGVLGIGAVCDGAAGFGLFCFGGICVVHWITSYLVFNRRRGSAEWGLFGSY